MTKKILVTIIFLFSVLLFTTKVNAQMMNWTNQDQTPPTQAEITDQQTMQDAGLKVWQNLQSGNTTCQNLTSDDYEKLGEYFMGQAAGSTQNHVYWDRQIQQMMGDQGDTNMHIAWGERGSGCIANAQPPSNTPSYFQGMMMGGAYQDQNQNSNSYSQDQNSNSNQGGENNMMWGYGAGSYAGWGAGFGVLGFLTWVVVIIDLVLLGFWLFKKIKK